MISSSVRLQGYLCVANLLAHIASMNKISFKVLCLNMVPDIIFAFMAKEMTHCAHESRSSRVFADEFFEVFVRGHV